MKRFSICILLAFALFAGNAMAQSAKFAASYDTDDIVLFAAAGDGPKFSAEAEIASLHVGSKKSILVGVSAQIGIHLLTVAKGKSVGAVVGEAMAMGDVIATVTLANVSGGDDCDVAPGPAW